MAKILKIKHIKDQINILKNVKDLLVTNVKHKELEDTFDLDKKNAGMGAEEFK